MGIEAGNMGKKEDGNKRKSVMILKFGKNQYSLGK